MLIEGYVDYQRREFCRGVKCPVQELLNEQEDGSEQSEKIRQICKENCLFTTHQFHKWLIEKGYLIVRPESLTASAAEQSSPEKDGGKE